MPADKTTQNTVDRFNRLLEMYEQDGASPPGQFPPVEHVRALREAEGRPDLDAVAQAHEQGQSPPDIGDTGGN